MSSTQRKKKTAKSRSYDVSHLWDSWKSYSNDDGQFTIDIDIDRGLRRIITGVRKVFRNSAIVAAEFEEKEQVKVFLLDPNLEK